jgi:hypothetical protein
MSTVTANIVLSVLVGLTTVYVIRDTRIAPFFKYFFIPFVLFFYAYRLIKEVSPGIDETGKNLSTYSTNKVYGEIDGMSYMELYPPMLLVLIIISILFFYYK